MKIDIMRQVNHDYLEKAIMDTGKANVHYLVMNSETKNVLVSGLFRAVSTMTDHGTYTKYLDYPIALYEGMPFGEVDIVTRLN